MAAAKKFLRRKILYFRLVNPSYLIRFFSGPVAALLIILFVDVDASNPMIARMMAVTVWMALWWLTEVVHLAVTSLLPFLLIPILGIADTTTIANEYMDPIMFLFIGGFILAIAIEHWNLHKRIALRILMEVGKSPASILAGVMGVTYFFSMWISNTATVLMMIAAVTAVVHQVERSMSLRRNEAAEAISSEKKGIVSLRQSAGLAMTENKIATGLFVGLAYSATIGGMATLVGTPPNMVFYRFYEKVFPQNHDMNFTQWFLIGFPISIVFLILSFFILKWMFISKSRNHSFDTSYFRKEYKNLGRMNYEEKVVSVIFITTAILWFTRAGIDFGNFSIPGWKNIFPNPENIQDGTVAIAMALLLFFIPSKSEKGKMLMTWNEAMRLPFHILLLFGSGFALAKGFEVSGLSGWLAVKLHFMKGVHPIVLVLGICALVTIISEFASNVASIQLMLPILLPLVEVLDVHPLTLMLPATFAASLGFMLPIATAPNTIVFGSGRIKVKDMMRAGLILDIIGIVIITLGIVVWK